MIYKNEIKNVNKIDTIIFDIDGTITIYDTMEKILKDTLKFFNVEYKESFSNQTYIVFAATGPLTENGIMLSYDLLYRSFEENSDFLKENNLPVKDFVDKLLEYERKYIRIHENTTRMLDKLNELGIKKVCFTNWFYLQADEKLKNVGIRNYFDKIYTCEDRYAKPNSKSFLEIVSLEDTNIENTLMIGDAKCDVLANKTGIQSILIDYNKTKSQELYDIANAVISDPIDIITILNK